MYFALRHHFGSLMHAAYFESCFILRSTKHCDEDMKIMEISFQSAYWKLYPRKRPAVMLYVLFDVYTVP